VAKRLRKNYQRRIKTKREEISTYTGMDLKSVSALNVAVSIKKRKAKGDLLNGSLQDNSINLLTKGTLN
jgi:hypothetical protein